MADPEKERPSLELPKLRLRRRTPAAPPAESVEVEPAAVEPAAAPPPAAESTAAVSEPTWPDTDLLDLEPPSDDEQPDEPVAAPPGPVWRGWRPAGMVAAVVTGLVVGLGTVGLTWAALNSCEGILGTSSCGGIGYPVLGLILVVMVLVGAVLLRLAGVVDPGTTSFLGLGLAVVIALLVLVDHLMDRSMVVVVPLVSAATYALAHWFVRTYIEPASD